MKKILTVVGARPQFIKSSTLSRAIAENKFFEEVIIHTGQHFDHSMSDVFFKEMAIPEPKYNLGIQNLSHGAMTGRMMEKIEEVLIKETPDLLLVYGDTNSTVAAAMAAAKNRIKVAHVEAGLRSFNMNMPEEQNRILTDRIADYLFCPTERSLQNLTNENINESPYGQKAFLVGDVMYDAFEFYKRKAQAIDISDKCGINESYVLATIHRAENTDNIERLKNILSALNNIADNTIVILPLHPRTEKIITKENINTGRIKIIKPLSYLDFLSVLIKSRLVLTDSGGLQKESYFAGKLCITLREETEWVELVREKVNFLAGSDTEAILNIYHGLNNHSSGSFFGNKSLYGDGYSSLKIVDIIEKLL